MNGTIEAERGASPDVTVHDVRIVLYDANREQIETVSVGDLSTNSELAPGIVAVNFTTKARPTYVLIESTDIWDKKHVSAEGHKRVDGRFDSYLVYSADEKFAAG
ncbi:hypothetical protein [Haloferax sp. DFSO60]|uniref:hypothetical protein n=1 Tax=Haloferax sp. DFSO60 TaxID=3388652 RepID=UPI00397E7D70